MAERDGRQRPGLRQPIPVPRNCFNQLMKLIIAPGAPTDGSFYLQEILRAFGLPCLKRMTLPDALREANVHKDLLLLPHGSESEGIEEFLQQGGHVLAIRPSGSLAALAGWEPTGEDNSSMRLRVVAAICAAARGEPFWTPGPRTVYSTKLPVEEQAAGALAYLFEPGNFHSECAGITERAVGAGVLTAFAYDPGACIALLRQGVPARAGIRPEDQAVPRSTFLHEPATPPDTAWRPTADLHAAVLCDVAVKLLERRAPVPLLWHVPGGQAAILLFSGDEDGAAQEDNQLEMNAVESYGATMGLYVIPGETSITPALVAEYVARGHEISVHPDMWPTAGKSVQEQLAKAEADVLAFRERFGQPVHTVRTHSGIWPGYLDLPELWERLGISMDSSCLASLYGQSPDHGPYVHVNAAMPLRFVREDGSLIDVYEQPPHMADDLFFHPVKGYSQKYSVEQSDWLIQRVLEDAAYHFHAPFCVIIHPSNYATFALEPGKALLRQAQRLNMPIWPLERWNVFWRARESWRMDSHSWNGSRVAFSLKGSPCEQLFVTLPATYDGCALRRLSLNGSASTCEIVERFKRAIGQAVLPAGVLEVEVVADYA